MKYKNDEFLEMASITQKTTGIKDVVIWIGPNPSYHGKRIKISNSPNSFNISDSFTLTIPEFEIIGNVDKKFITTEILNQIKEFININIDLISDYSNMKISTEDLIENLIRI